MAPRLLFFALSLVAAQAQTYTFTTFDVPGAAHTLPGAINNAGQIVGSYVDAAGVTRCFLRSADGATYTTLDPPNGAVAGNFACSGINNVGQIVGSFRDAKGTHLYIRSAAGEFTIFDPPGFNGPGEGAFGINDLGEVVGTAAAPPDGDIGFLRHADGSFTPLNGPGSTVPTAINNKGEIAGWLLNGSSLGTQHGFLRSAGGAYSKYDLPGTISYTRIYALNNAGQFAGGSVSGPGFVHNADGTVVVLSGHFVSGMNDSGVVVGSVFDGKANHGFIGTPGPSTGEPKIRTGLPGVMKALALTGDRSPLTPGTWAEIYGENLAPGTREWRTSDFRNGAAPTSLDGVAVTFGGVPAYVSYISPQQVNVFVPATVGIGETQVVLTNGGRTAAPYTINVGVTPPSLFTIPVDFMTGYLVAVYPDFQTYVLPPQYTNVPTRPAKAGDVIVFFGAGFGAVSPAVPDGQVATQPASITAAVTVGFSAGTGVVPAKVLYAGVVPGTVGLYQFNVVVPQLTFPAGQDTMYAGLVVNVDRGPTLGPRYPSIPVTK